MKANIGAELSNWSHCCDRPGESRQPAALAEGRTRKAVVVDQAAPPREASHRLPRLNHVGTIPRRPALSCHLALTSSVTAADSRQ
jgi:hypothetical protein